jgi:hypothetical protein
MSKLKMGCKQKRSKYSVRIGVAANLIPTAVQPPAATESAFQGIHLLPASPAQLAKESHHMPTPTPAEIIALRMSLLEALNLFSENAGPEDKRLATETNGRLCIAISREIDEGASTRHIFKAIIALAIGAVATEVQWTSEGPVQIDP